MIIPSDEDVLKECEKLGVAGVEAALASGSFLTNTRPALQWLAQHRLESESQRHQQTMKYALWALIASWLTAAAALSSVWFQKIDNREQRKLAKEQLELQLKDSQAQREDANKQASQLITEIASIANSIGETAQQSKKSLEATIENSRLEQRAWVGTVEVFPAQYEDNGKKIYVKEGQQVSAGAYITNTGKTPARKLYAVTSMQAMISGVAPSAKYKILGAAQPTITTSKPTYGVMLPGMKFALKPQPIDGRVSKSDIEDFTSGRYIIYLTGKITYEDIFQRPHKTTFCMYLKPDLETFSACSTGNEAD